MAKLVVKKKYIDRPVYLNFNGELIAVGGDAHIPAKPPKKSRVIKEATKIQYEALKKAGHHYFFEDVPEVSKQKDTTDE